VAEVKQQLEEKQQSAAGPSGLSDLPDQSEGAAAGNGTALNDESATNGESVCILFLFRVLIMEQSRVMVSASR